MGQDACLQPAGADEPAGAYYVAAGRRGADAEPDAHRDAEPDADGHAHPDAKPHADGYAHRNCYAAADDNPGNGTGDHHAAPGGDHTENDHDQDRTGHHHAPNHPADGHAHAHDCAGDNARTEPDADGNGFCDADPGAFSHTYAYAHAEPDADSHTDAYPDTDGNAYAHAGASGAQRAAYCSPGCLYSGAQGGHGLGL